MNMKIIILIGILSLLTACAPEKEVETLTKKESVEDSKTSKKEEYIVAEPVSQISGSDTTSVSQDPTEEEQLKKLEPQYDVKENEPISTENAYKIKIDPPLAEEPINNGSL